MKAGKVVPPRAEAPCWPIFEAFQLTYVSRGLLLEQEKTPPRSRRLVLRQGRALLRRLPNGVRRLPGAVIGWDLSAALALGVPPLAMAELLPVIEAVMVRKLKEEMVANSGPGLSP